MRFISVGGDCQVAHQILRLRPDDYEKHLFDWIVCPISTAIRLINHRFEHLLQEEDLVADLNPNSPHPYKVVDSFNNIWLIHDYETYDKENISKVNKKFSYLSGKFLALLQSQTPTCFVRLFHEHDVRPEELEARKLLEALQNSNPNCMLLYIHQNIEAPDIIDGAFRSTHVPATPGNWQGDDTAWARVLLEFVKNHE